MWNGRASPSTRAPRLPAFRFIPPRFLVPAGTPERSTAPPPSWPPRSGASAITAAPTTTNTASWAGIAASAALTPPSSIFPSNTCRPASRAAARPRRKLPRTPGWTDLAVMSPPPAYRENGYLNVILLDPDERPRYEEALREKKIGFRQRLPRSHVRPTGSGSHTSKPASAPRKQPPQPGCFEPPPLRLHSSGRNRRSFGCPAAA